MTFNIKPFETNSGNVIKTALIMMQAS